MNDIVTNIVDNETVHLMCPKCGNSREIPVTSFSQKDNRYRVQCRCGYSYIIMLERRSFNRKTTDLRGTYTTASFGKDEIIDIINLSTTGLCLVRRDDRELTVGQFISLIFRLDNFERDEIKCQAVIRQINDKKIGVEFLDLSPGAKRMLGFYLFNYVDKEDRVQEINFPIFRQAESAG